MAALAPILVLAGGQARRMGGGDKPLRPFRDQTLLDAVLARARLQSPLVLLNANGDPGRFERFGLLVLPDSVPGQPGPLAGVLAGLEHLASHHPECGDLVTMPGDAPFLPRTLVADLSHARARESAELACAGSGGRLHPVAALWPVRLAPLLRLALCDEGLRRVDRFLGRFRLAVEQYPVEPVDPFFNANTPEELALAEQLAQNDQG